MDTSPLPQLNPSPTQPTQTDIPARNPHRKLYVTVGIFTVIIIAGAVWSFRPTGLLPYAVVTISPTTERSSEPAASAQPTNSHDYTLTYAPPWFALTPADIGDPFMDTLEYRSADTEGTNFADAFIKIAKSTADDPSMCLTDIASKKPLTETFTTAEGLWYINRYSDAGAGNFYSTVAYTMLRGDTCYDVQVDVHVLNRGNFADPSVIQEFNQAPVFSSAQTVVSSLRFIPE